MSIQNRSLPILMVTLAFAVLATKPGRVRTEILLTSYLPASMQALAYYIDLLQYEPLATTTVEPPFLVNDTDTLTSSTSATPTSTSTTTSTRTPTRRPITSATTSTRRPGGTTLPPGVWWQPPNWWQPSTTPRTTTTRKPEKPTAPHRPAIFAPQFPPYRQPPAKLEGIELFREIGSKPEGFDQLPLSLIRDIQTEIEHDEFNNDVESLDNFLRLYDDNYGRVAFEASAGYDRWSSTSTAGQKRVPPTKPYVEFLLVYDLLKRDAKAANLSKYEGYAPELLRDLHELSSASAERQLYTLFKRMLDRGDIQRSDVVSRIQSIMRDLVDPNSITVKSLRYIPALQFLP